MVIKWKEQGFDTMILRCALWKSFVLWTWRILPFYLMVWIWQYVVCTQYVPKNWTLVLWGTLSLATTFHCGKSDGVACFCLLVSRYDSNLFMYSDATKKHYAIIKQEAETPVAALLFDAPGWMDVACLWAFFFSLAPFVFGQSPYTLNLFDMFYSYLQS
jgi:hypothetical protein